MSGIARLPPGRHGLSREFVKHNQRSRIEAGIISVVAESGYHETTISRIAAAADVSRRTFYAYFSSKEECFLATYDMVFDHLCQAANTAARGTEEWPAAVRARLATGLDFFAANPDLARFCLIAPVRAGEKIAARHRLMMATVVTGLANGMASPPAIRAPSPAVQDSQLGGMVALLVRMVEIGEGERLPELLPELLQLFLTPYLGREDAFRLARPRTSG